MATDNGSVLLHADLYAAKLKSADLRGADVGPVDLERLGALSGAIISRAQAAALRQPHPGRAGERRGE